MKQLAAAGAVVAELHEDGVARDLDALHLLDIMAVVGVSFTTGGLRASAAFLAEAAGRTEDEVAAELLAGPPQ